MKVDGRLEVILVPEAVGHLLNRLDFGVEALAHRIGDPVPKVGDDIGLMALDHPRYLPHRRQLRMSGPPEPALPEPLGTLRRRLRPAREDSP
jgi:hypothetical protein